MTYPKPFPLHKCCFLTGPNEGRCPKKPICVIKQSVYSFAGYKDFPLCREHLEINNRDFNKEFYGTVTEIKFFDKAEAVLFFLDGCNFLGVKISYFRNVKEKEDVQQLDKTLAGTRDEQKDV